MKLTSKTYSIIFTANFPFWRISLKRPYHALYKRFRLLSKTKKLLVNMAQAVILK